MVVSAFPLSALLASLCLPDFGAHKPCFSRVPQIELFIQDSFSPHVHTQQVQLELFVTAKMQGLRANFLPNTTSSRQMGQDSYSGPSECLCSDTCETRRDGVCDDGGLGAAYSVCANGTDCSDCGPRSNASSSVAQQMAVCVPGEMAIPSTLTHLCCCQRLTTHPK